MQKTPYQASHVRSSMTETQMLALLEQHYGIAARRLLPLGRGLINRTYLAELDSGQRHVLQALNAIFPPAINEDIDAVTSFLAAGGMTTPRLVRSLTGAAWVDYEGETWRLLSWVDGISLDRLEGADQAAGAGGLLGRFHHRLADFKHRFHNPRLGVHDTAKHLRNLRQALRDGDAHRHISVIRPLAIDILDAAASLTPLPPLPDRVVHGDPKINNILFDAAGARALCLVDLDTLGHMPLPLELGDALRSWCNMAGEDSVEASFSESLFESAISAYAGETRSWLRPAEWESIVPATQTIFVELAARFCADALQESYFGWDAGRYDSRSEHNQVRARGQLAAFHACRAQTERLDNIVRAAFVAGKA